MFFSSSLAVESDKNSPSDCNLSWKVPWNSSSNDALLILYCYPKFHQQLKYFPSVSLTWGGVTYKTSPAVEILPLRVLDCDFSDERNVQKQTRLQHGFKACALVWASAAQCSTGALLCMLRHDELQSCAIRDRDLSQWGRPPLLQAVGKSISCLSQWRVTIPHWDKRSARAQNVQWTFALRRP